MDQSRKGLKLLSVAITLEFLVWLFLGSVYAFYGMVINIVIYVVAMLAVNKMEKETNEKSFAISKICYLVSAAVTLIVVIVLLILKAGVNVEELVDETSSLASAPAKIQNAAAYLSVNESKLKVISIVYGVIIGASALVKALFTSKGIKKAYGEQAKTPAKKLSKALVREGVYKAVTAVLGGAYIVTILEYIIIYYVNSPRKGLVFHFMSAITYVAVASKLMFVLIVSSMLMLFVGIKKLKLMKKLKNSLNDYDEAVEAAKKAVAQAQAESVVVKDSDNKEEVKVSEEVIE
jgi:hypothetical protein